MKRRVMLACTILLSLASAGRAAEPPIDQVYEGQIPDLVPALIVQAVTPGPAWWKVTKGDSTLWIMGTPPYLSTADDWDQSVLARRLKGAKAFIIPLYMEPQPLRYGRTDPYFDGMEPPRTVDLPGPLKARLKSVANSWNILPITDNSSVIFATRMVNLAMLQRAGLSTQAMPEKFAALAQAAGIKPEIPRFNDERIATDYNHGSDLPKLGCLEKTLDVAESSANPLRWAYEAWAQGDVPNALATVGCVGVKGAAYKQEVAYLIPMLRRQLAQPGKSVAAIELTPLLMKEGVIERLAGMGYDITPPDSLRDPA